MAAERPVPDAAETPPLPAEPEPGLGTSIWVDDRRGAARRDLKRRFASDDVLDDVLRWLEFESGRAALFDVTTRTPVHRNRLSVAGQGAFLLAEGRGAQRSSAAGQGD